MTDCTCPQCAANRARWNAAPTSTPTRVAPLEDVDTLRRSHRSLTPNAPEYRRRFDQPTEAWADEIAVATGSVRVAEVER